MMMHLVAKKSNAVKDCKDEIVLIAQRNPSFFESTNNELEFRTTEAHEKSTQV